ncbi:hypothetical protein J0S82_006624 [Galemys pyrenaicus]|uniref:Uncharacterized protein n=1 Tax=Galemys pyrenaicus TaxID=202257 RepID=A0A8J5ZQQ1_GALPY|nr:hypothetical protein J0S82_006624 [Galemys pyrenaicus]
MAASILSVCSSDLSYDSRACLPGSSQLRQALLLHVPALPARVPPPRLLLTGLCPEVLPRSGLPEGTPSMSAQCHLHPMDSLPRAKTAVKAPQGPGGPSGESVRCRAPAADSPRDSPDLGVILAPTALGLTKTLRCCKRGQECPSQHRPATGKAPSPSTGSPGPGHAGPRQCPHVPATDCTASCGQALCKAVRVRRRAPLDRQTVARRTGEEHVGVGVSRPEGPIAWTRLKNTTLGFKKGQLRPDTHRRCVHKVKRKQRLVFAIELRLRPLPGGLRRLLRALVLQLLPLPAGLLHAHVLHARLLQACVLHAHVLHARLLQACVLHAHVLHARVLQARVLLPLLPALVLQLLPLPAGLLHAHVLHAHLLQARLLHAHVLHARLLQACVLHARLLQARVLLGVLPLLSLLLPAQPLPPALRQALLLRVPALPARVQTRLLRPRALLPAQLRQALLLRVPALPARVPPPRLLLTLLAARRVPSPVEAPPASHAVPALETKGTR